MKVRDVLVVAESLCITIFGDELEVQTELLGLGAEGANLILGGFESCC